MAFDGKFGNFFRNMRGGQGLFGRNTTETVNPYADAEAKWNRRFTGPAETQANQDNPGMFSKFGTGEGWLAQNFGDFMGKGRESGSFIGRGKERR